jgi:hypothetical protein
MRGVYTHVSDAMRTEVKDALQVRWEGSPRARRAIPLRNNAPTIGVKLADGEL